MESEIPGKKPSIVRKIYLTDPLNEKTFQYDETLNSLPLPDLGETLSKYLQSIKPFVSNEQFAHTKHLVENFEKGIGQVLQSKLQIRQKSCKNWLADWWLKYAYLKNREPLAPLTNMSGPQALSLTIWDASEETALEQMSLFLWVILDVFLKVREQRMKPNVSKDGKKLSMDQFRYVFNTTRIPMEEEDELKCKFKTKDEGDCPRHLIVICLGHIWFMDPWYTEDKSLTPPEMEAQFKYIQKMSTALGEGQGVGTLTFDDREHWAKNRRWLASLSPRNAENLELIDGAIMVYTLDDSCPADLDEACYIGLCGNPRSRWADKSYGGITFRNGYHALSNDHTPYDAMVNVMIGHYQLGIIQDEYEGKWKGETRIRDTSKPYRLIFDIDNVLRSSMERILSVNAALRKSIGVIFREFNAFGKDWFSKQKIHGDSFVQCGLQLAYFLTHRKFAPTYETATTRQFFKGRTETVRSCTSEMVEFVNAMTSDHVLASEKKAALLKAINRHLQQMVVCRNGKGIDRHLMGLAIVASENGIPTPDIFTDPSFAMSGGGGNFVLSTSTVGFTEMVGGVAAMVKDGYGIFYAIAPNKMLFYMTSFVDGESNLQHLYQALSESLEKMHDLFTENRSKL